MIFLLSPAKSLNYQSPIKLQSFTIPYFAKDTEILISKIKKFSVLEIEELMDVSNKLAILNHERFAKFSTKYNPENSKQALLVFDGDVYKPIELENFNNRDFDFAQLNLRILSGLYGLLKPLDLIQPYRLEMGIDFKDTIIEKELGAQNLYKFWSDKISDYINFELKERGNKFLLNLASEEYFSAINQKRIKAEIVNVIFKEKKNGVYKVIGINAKKARGVMANFIIKNKISNPDDIKSFDLLGYKFSNSLSDENSFVFVRG